MSKKKVTSYPQYLVCGCTSLADQWECEFERTVKFVTNDKNEAMAKKPYNFEVYGITANGQCVLIKNAND